MSRQTDKAAAAVRDLVLRAVDRVVLPDYGIVRTTNPIQVELGDEATVIDSDELVVTQAVRQYDKDVGLVAGDSLVLVPTRGGELIAVGVLAEKTLTAAPVTSDEMDDAIALAIAAALASAGAAAWSPGDLKPTARASAPAGWLLCDGSTVSRTTYAALFSAIGTTYNTGGEAGTDFRLPNGVGRSLIGAGTGTAGDATAHARGAYGGTETQDLTIANLPAHDHGAATGSQTTGISINNTTATGTVAANTDTFSGTTAATNPLLPNAGVGTAVNPSALFGGGGYTNSITSGITGYNGTALNHTHTFSGTTAGHAHTLTMNAHAHTITDAGHTHTIASQGSGTKHNNLSPFFVGLWLVKT